MEEKVYEPPVQSGASMAWDAVFIILLIYVVLLLPIVLGLTAGKTITNIPENVTWETLGQNEQMVAQWEKQGIGIDEAAELICTKFDYSVNPIALIITLGIVVAYYIILIWAGGSEFKDVIHEKFEIMPKLEGKE
jgi:hypothetical protein